MKTLVQILFLVSIVMVAGCTKMSSTNTVLTVSGKTQYGVVLQPTGSKLKVISKPKGWNKAGKKDGYVGFAKGESGIITFGIKNSEVGDSCPAYDGGASWVITKMELSGTGDSATEKGDNFGGDQTAQGWLQQAFPDVDLSDGVIFEAATLEEGRTSVSIIDANNQIGRTFAYYQVTATKCSDGTTVQIDPGVGNGGRR